MDAFLGMPAGPGNLRDGLPCAGSVGGVRRDGGWHAMACTSDCRHGMPDGREDAFAYPGRRRPAAARRPAAGAWLARTYPITQERYTGKRLRAKDY
jgi:hypothetical protein